MVGKCVLLLFGFFLIAHSHPDDPAITCPCVVENGEHEGFVIGVVHRQEWTKSNYFFKPKGEEKPHCCVNVDHTLYPTRAKLMWEALKNHLPIKMLVVGNHDCAGVAIIR